ncbi:hypothetical protein QFC21_003037 [Naganishia friedmannii]|uniref:Uncharacterized protein n=1 Tax=Naganishia friedmannii TaxID=89922 RepID=A0ACC2VRS5_9TREE|nr:hypothetical protein QFC21_003037 [Naganishia friedmannii]
MCKRQFRIAHLLASSLASSLQQLWVTIPMIVYDIALNIVLTSCFLYPIRSETQYNYALRRMAFRTVFASFASFGSSTINIALVAAWKGHQQGWFCLLACSLDVLVNAFAIYWVTKPGEWSRNAEGFNPAPLLTTRRSIDTRAATSGQTNTGNPEVNKQPRQSNSTGSAGVGKTSRLMEDKDEYLRPMRDVYYPMGEGNFRYGESVPPPPLSYDAEQGVSGPLRPPQPTLLQIPRRQSELMRAHTVSLNALLPATPHTAAGSLSRSDTGSAEAVVPVMEFADFLNDEADRAPLDAQAERRRISQEQAEGRMQRCFFDMVLGKSKAGAAVSTDH